MGGVVVVHVLAGLTGIVAGTIALCVRKGDRLHRQFGAVFFVAMLTMSGAGAVLAALLGEAGNVAGGISTFYLVLTAWLVVRRRPGQVGRPEAAALAGGLVVGLLDLSMGVMASQRPDGNFGGSTAGGFIVFAAVVLLAVGLDVRVVLRGGISGRPRIVRHVWRVCLGLFVATGSFFLGQQKVMPVAIQGSPALFVPAFAPLVVMVFWMVRLWGTRWVRRIVAVA
jgi:uncharacterized membrane protein